MRLRPVWPKRIVAALLAAAAAALWGGFASERPIASHAARPVHAANADAGARKGLSSLPLAAQGVVSATFGSENRGYRVSGSGAEYHAVNPAQRLRVRFDRAGVDVQSGQARLGLRPEAVGYGASLTALAPVAPRAQDNRVVYVRQGLKEWYANGPLGLEQGFTLTRAPTGDVGKPLTLSLALSGDVRASVDAAGRGVTLNAPAGASLRYDNLLATDARRRALRSWITLHGGHVFLHVDAHGARYPLRIDPLVQQAKLIGGTSETGKAFMGYSVALSAAGTVAVVGGYEEESESGAAWMFTYEGSEWHRDQKLKRGGTVVSAKGWFGIGVAISANAETVLVGAPLEESSVGAAWVFTRESATHWKEAEKLKVESGGGEEGTGNFGHDVALSGNGKTALIGAFGNNGGTGAAWVFTNEGKWKEGPRLTGAGETGECYFGFSVALSGDGKTALIGSHVEKSHVGAAWVWHYSGTEWKEQAKLLPGAGEEVGKGDFGYSVALSENGSTALVGAIENNEGVGAVWVFTRPVEAWSKQAKLTGGEEESGAGWFGFSVALTANGKTALVGAPQDKESLGAAWEFVYTEEKWVRQGKITAEKEEVGKGSFGSDVALSEAGGTALFGGETDKEDLGAAWVYD